MECPNCKTHLPAFVDRTADAKNLADSPNDFLVETPRGALLRVRVTFTRHDTEAGFFHYKVQIAPAADLSGDVLRGATDENILFPAFSVALKEEAIIEGKEGLTGILAAAIAQQLSTAEARLFVSKQLVSRFGPPAEPEAPT